MIPTISQICSLNSPFQKDLEDYAAGQCTSIELWLTKLEDYLQTHSDEAFRQLRERQAVQTPVASYQGGLLTSQGAQREAAWQLFERRLQLCHRLDIGMLVVACDVAAPLSQPDLDRLHVSLQQVAQVAERYGRRVALEFQAGSALGNNLQTAAALVAEVDSPQLGLCLDVFHFWVGPSKLTDLAYLTADNLFHVQVSDLAGVARELATDSDRILPGDGDCHFQPLLDRFAEIGYCRCVSLELMNPQIWQIPALQVGEIGMTALRKLLGLAEGP